MLKTLIIVGLGGAFGAIGRYAVALFLNSEKFPNATLAVNVLGSLLIGAAYVLFVERQLFNDELRMLMMVGFLGAFTTFSTFSLETIRLLEAGNMLTALVYTALSLLLCFIAAWLAMFITRQL